MPSLFLRNNGYYTIAYWDNGRRRWHSTRTRTEGEARAYFDSIVPTLERRKPTTIMELRDAILQYARVNLSPKTIELYRISFDKFIECVGNKPVRFLTPMDGERFKEFLVRGMKQISANIYVRTIKAAFNKAIQLGLLVENALKVCKPLKTPIYDPIYLAPEQFILLIHAIEESWFRVFILFAVLTGMRRGELISLRWSDVDLSNRMIRIANKPEFTVKGMRPRMIPINKDLFTIISSMERRSDHVFVGKNGRPLRPDYVTKKFKVAVRKAGLPETIHLHSTRHTYASYLLQASTPLAEIQRLLGHQSITTTQIYSHLEEHHLRAAAERLRLPEFASPHSD